MLDMHEIAFRGRREAVMYRAAGWKPVCIVEATGRLIEIFN